MSERIFSYNGIDLTKFWNGSEVAYQVTRGSAYIALTPDEFKRLTLAFRNDRKKTIAKMFPKPK